MDQKGQISPDGRWLWDGQRWLTTISPDGAWKWNGQAWLPARQSAGLSGRWSDFGFIRKLPGFRTGTRWKVAAASVAYLGAGWLAGLTILAVIGAAAGLGPPPSHTTPSPVAQLVAASPTPVGRNNPPSASPVAAAQPTRSPSPSPSPSPAASHAPSPIAPPVPPPPPPPPPNTCGAPSNPWGYNFCGGNLIYSPPSNFCNYFNCIPSFWKSTLGYVDECKDGTYSHSGGRQGACSYHGGEMRPLYSS
jgi:hypothetical protein